MTTTRELFLKKSARMQSLALGGVLTITGGVLMHFYGGIALVLVAAGAAILIVGMVRGRRAVVSLDASSVVLRFSAPLAVPFRTITRVDQTKALDLELCLQNGARVLIPMSKLEEEDGAWLKKTLRKQVRTQNAP